MGTTRKRWIGRALALSVGAAAVALPLWSAAPASAAPAVESGTISDSIDLTSLPSDATLSLPRIDPTTVDIFGLTEVTITATLESSLTGSVENLSSTHEKTISVTAHVDLTMTSDALTSDLQAGHAHAETFVLAPGASSPIDLADSDELVEVIDQADLLDALFAVLVGETGTIDFDVSGVVDTSVSGPAPYLSTGVAAGRASVTIDYEYVEVCAFDPTLPADDPQCEPPVICEDFERIEPVTEGTHLDGRFTIVDIYDNGSGPVFDWTSTVPVLEIAVKGGPAWPGELYDYAPDGATSDNGLHAPLNERNGQWFGLSHIDVCFGDPVEVCEYDPQLPADSDLCVPPPPPPPPAPECVDWDFKVDPVTVGVTDIPGGGTFTVTKVDQDAKTFDWESTVPIAVVAVKGGPQGIPRQEFVYDPPATSGTGLHAPDNPRSGTTYGLSHLEVCVARESGDAAPESSEQQTEREGTGDKSDGGAGGQRGSQQSQSAPAPQEDQDPAPPEPAPEEQPKDPEEPGKPKEPKEQPVEPKGPPEEPETTAPEPAAAKQKDAAEGDGSGDGGTDDDTDGDRDGGAGETGSEGQGDQ